jgi:Alpha/beta-hydrolase family
VRKVGNGASTAESSSVSEVTAEPASQTVGLIRVPEAGLRSLEDQYSWEGPAKPGELGGGRSPVSEPDWISQPPGRNVLNAMCWAPFVTFWLVTADLPFAASAPAGHGHVATAEFADGWKVILRPAGITAGRAGHPQENNRERRIQRLKGLGLTQQSPAAWTR